MAEREDDETMLEVVIDCGPGKPVPAKTAAKVIEGVIKLLEVCETAVTGKPPEIVWVLKSVTNDELPKQRSLFD